MGKLLVLGFVGTWIGVWFGCGLDGWLGIAQASVAAQAWSLVWFVIAIAFDT